MEIPFYKFFYGDDEVVAFIDESGDEVLKDPNNPVFVLGCCMVRGRDLPALREGWLVVRERVLGNRDARMHMRELRLDEQQDAVIREFFDKGVFYRTSITVTDRTVFQVGPFPFLPIFQIAMGLVGQLVAALMTGQPSHGLSLVIEDNERLRSLYFAHLSKHRLLMDGISMPVSWALLTKKANEPALEIADYISHSTAGFMRSNRDETSKFAPRYKAIFPDQSYAKAWELNDCKLVENTEVPNQLA